MTCSDQFRCEVLGHFDLASDPVTSHSAIEGERENSAFPRVPTRHPCFIAINPAGRVTADSIAPVRTSPIVHELLDVETMVGERAGGVDLDIPSTVDLRGDVARIPQFLTWANNRCRSLGRQSGQSRWRRDQGTGAALRIPSQVSRNPLDSEAEAVPPARPSLAPVLALKLAAQASQRYALAAVS